MVVEYKLYQIKDIANCKYAFMDYEFAKDKFNLKDYELVAINDEYKYDNINITLENIFINGNTGKITGLGKPMRSVSVSDVIEIENKLYYVDSMGFIEIEK